MRVWLMIAKRYFLSRQKRNFINILSAISFIGIAVGTAALVIVLSAFNGMRDVARSMYQVFDPAIKVVPTTGKYLTATPELLAKISKTQGVAEIAQVLEDNALLMHGQDQAIIKLKAISPTADFAGRMKSQMIGGSHELTSRGKPYALVGIGIVQALRIDPQAGIDDIQVWYPKTKKKIGGSINPENAFNKRYISVGGAFGIEANFDNTYVITPIDYGVELMQAGEKRTSIEISVVNGHSVSDVKTALQEAIGGAFIVQDADDQHADLIKILRMEKLFVFVALSFILLIASFNIYVSLSMLAVDKQRDLALLRSLGANDQLLKNIFLGVGSMIALTGASVGLILGFGLCWLQMNYGLVSMGISNALIDAYPITVESSDLLAIGLVIVLITLLASFGPAMKASKIQTRLAQD